MKIWAIILAAGQGTRLADLGSPKQFLEYKGRPLYWQSALAMSSVAKLSGLVFVFPADQLCTCKAEIDNIYLDENIGLPVLSTAGGARRQDSVANGIAVLPKECTHVLVHDGARPFVTPHVINRVCDALAEGAFAAIPAIEVTDTIKEVKDNKVTQTFDRSLLRAVQTPQGFELARLKKAHQKAQSEGLEVTDDAMLLEQLGETVKVVEGDMNNIKITTPADLASLKPEECAPSWLPCNGFGYDVHKFGAGRPMKLGGVPISGGPEVIAHSDGDVLLHALTDALLGCLGEGDIGLLFPDSSAEFENIDSGILLSEVMDKINAANIKICHVDLTIIAQIPRLTPWRDIIRKNIASLLHLPREVVNVKATTEEGLGFTGEKKGIKAVALVSAYKLSLS